MTFKLDDKQEEQDKQVLATTAKILASVKGSDTKGDVFLIALTDVLTATILSAFKKDKQIDTMEICFQMIRKSIETVRGEEELKEFTGYMMPEIKV